MDKPSHFGQDPDVGGKEKLTEKHPFWTFSLEITTAKRLIQKEQASKGRSIFAIRLILTET